MRSTGKSWLCLVALVAGTVGGLFAGEFAPPKDGPVAFRRDRLPLEPDAMASLSRQLEQLAGGLDAKTAADRRGAAQMLALALALDPGNAKARKRIAEYQGERHHPDVEAERVEASRRRIRKFLAWLETPDAGKDGQALADCLKDVLAISEHVPPKADGSVVEEKGEWAGWIPSISAYEKTVEVTKDFGKQAADEEPAGTKRILLENAEVQTPLWQRVGKGASMKWVLKPSPLKMSARQVKGADGKLSGFRIVIGPRQELGSLKRVGDSLKILLRKNGVELPPGVEISIDSREFEESLQANQPQSISAAAAVLASSAITGCEPDAIIIGQVDENGAFTLPTRFWYQLKELGKGTGQRLVLPIDAAGFMPSILAMEKPEFFFEYEVLLAKDFEQLLALTAKVPEGATASAIAKFGEIRERRGRRGLRTYIDNGFVKQRLASVLQDMPFHASARMLLTQASGDRPGWLSRKVVAAELRLALAPVSTIKSPQLWSRITQDLANVGEIYETCRAMVDGLERYTEKSDRDLLEEAREVAIAIRTLDKSTRSRGYNSEVLMAVQTAYSDLKRQYKTLDRKLVIEAGDGNSANVGPLRHSGD